MTDHAETHDPGLGIDVGDRFRRAGGVDTEQVGAESILLDNAHGCVHVLNVTATWLWEHCTADLDVGQLTARFAESFAKDVDEVSGDVTRLLQDLSRQGLVERVAVAPKS